MDGEPRPIALFSLISGATSPFTLALIGAVIADLISVRRRSNPATPKELTTHLPGQPAALPGARGLKVYLEGIRSHETQQRDQSFVEARGRWVEQRKAQGAESSRSTGSRPVKSARYSSTSGRVPEGTSVTALD